MRDLRKQRLAQELIETVSPLALLWQVGCKFIAASRKLEPFGFARPAAWAALEDMRAMSDVLSLPDGVDWRVTRELQDRVSLSFWDALLISSCLRHGVTTLYSEDMGAPRTIDGLRIVNPFETASA